FARGTSSGDASQVGVYAFDVGPSGATLGFHPAANNLTPGAITLRVVNDTGAAVDDWMVEFDLFFLNIGHRSHRFDLSFSTDDVSYLDVAGALPNSDTTADASPVWDATNLSRTIKAHVEHGDSLYLKWSTGVESGLAGYDEFALNNVSVTAVPEPTAFLYGGVVCAIAMLAYGCRRASEDRIDFTAYQ
ncbi:MAG: hypothetical protein AAF961_17365, partial [Planctomycetota bacterium]